MSTENPIGNYTAVSIALVSAVTMVVGAIVTTRGCTNASTALAAPTTQAVAQTAQVSALSEINLGKALVFAGSMTGGAFLWKNTTGNNWGLLTGALLGVVPALIVINSATSKCAPTPTP